MRKDNTSLHAYILDNTFLL